MQLENKIAVVTGASAGIGQAIATELAEHGARVVVHYHSNQAGAQETVQTITKAESHAIAIQANLEHVHECIRLIQESVQAYGSIDILVNNAAVSTEARFIDVSQELWDQTLNTNLRAPFFCAQAAAHEMMQREGGKIVNIGSVHGLRSLPLFGPYAAAKGGLNMLTRQMAIELAPHRINVNCVAPGLTEVERYHIQFPDYDRDEAAHKVPWGRVGSPQDIAPIVAFLCSGAADFITGQVIYVDGGQTSALRLRR
jgi:NAD(P)-dependent dehydrogenase (short-subunit alcohol dehydrogenase family)